MKPILLVLTGLLFVSCVTGPGNDAIPTAFMDPTLHYTGFLINRPESNWFIYRHESFANKIIIRREQTSKTYDCFFEAHLYQEDRQPTSLDDFEAIVKDDVTSILDKSRLPVLNVSTAKTIRQGQWCVNFETTFQDNKPANSDTPLIMFNKGFVILHPSQPKTVVQAMISQRGLSDEIDRSLSPDMQEILDSLRLTDKANKLVE